jgi:hypothetical protein
MAGVFGFFSTFGKKQAEGFGQSIMQKLVEWDPATASEAEIEEMIKKLDELTMKAGEAKAIYDREQKEADVIQANYDKAYNYAQTLESKGETDKLNALLTELEKMKPELDREVKEAVEAKQFYDELTELAKSTANKVKTARETLKTAQRDMEKAKLSEQTAKERAQQAEYLAGIRKDTGDLGGALDAMKKSAEKARAAADASNLKATLLKPDASSDILAEAINASAAPKSDSPSDRLAALKRA